MAPRLLEKYRQEIIPEMMRAFGISNKFAVPRLEKIVINIGVGQAVGDIKILEKAMEDIALITGQKPILRRAKKAIANFKIKKSNPIGGKVTLRWKIMYEFMDRFFNIALPRLRDFRGVPLESFDKAGNYSLGLSEQTIFPEIDYDRLSRAQGMDITFVIKNAKSKDQARELLRLFGMPFQMQE